MAAFSGAVMAPDLDTTALSSSVVGGWSFECKYVTPVSFQTFPESEGGGSAVPDQSPGGVAIF